MREFLAILLRQEGYQCVPARRRKKRSRRSMPSGRASCYRSQPSRGRRDRSPQTFKARAATLQNDVSVVVVTAYGTTESAIEAMRMGASDYVLKAVQQRRAAARREEGARAPGARGGEPPTQARAKGKHHFGQLVGDSESMKRIYEMVRRSRTQDQHPHRG
jgi:DNA-binding NtrC family response regulator